MTPHEKTYAALLAAFVTLLGITVGMLLAFVPATPRPVLFILGAYLLGTLLTLVIRVILPQKARVPTLLLNIALLPYFPIGTAIAIYGFAKVDKGQPDCDPSPSGA